jgi:hypothetical protein
VRPSQSHQVLVFPGRPVGTSHRSGGDRACRQCLQPIAAPIGHLGPVDLAGLPISTFEKGCGFVSGLLPLRFAHLEKLFSDSVLWHVAELIEDCQNGRTANGPRVKRDQAYGDILKSRDDRPACPRVALHPHRNQCSTEKRGQEPPADGARGNLEERFHGSGQHLLPAFMKD